MGSFGALVRVGVEGTGSYGAGLARCLAAAGVEVVEVNRPNRQTRRRRDKTDTVDAGAAARAALCGDATAEPKSGDGCVEAIRMLGVARRCAVKARTQAANQISGLIVTAPEHLKDRLKGLNTNASVEVCARWRPESSPDSVTAVAKTALRSLAQRHQALTAETSHLDAELRNLCQQANPALLGAVGVEPEVAASLLVTAGDNPHRMHSEASFAALCAASPVEASSDAVTRHRLNRGGDRNANNALWRIAHTRLRCDERTIAYAQPRRADGKTRPEIIRCLKRYIAHEVYRLLTDPPETPDRAHLRRSRLDAGLTIVAVAAVLNAAPARISELERGICHNRELAERYQRHITEITT